VIRYTPVNLNPVLMMRPLGQKKVGQTFDQYLHFTPAMGDVLRLVFHGIAVYLGVVVGLNAKYIKASKTTKTVTVALAWALAGGQGIGAIADVVSLAQRALGTHPPEPPTATVEASVAPTPPIR
jgi:hypothetical protein